MPTKKWFSRIANSLVPLQSRTAKAVILSGLSCLLAYSQATSNIVAGYYQMGGALPLSKLTSNNAWYHMDYLIYAFATINTANYTCELSSDTDISALASIRKSNPSLRLLISVGGENTPVTSFQTAANSTYLSSFASSCVDMFISGKGTNTTNIFDGIDVDWEFPTANYQAEYNSLLSTLRSDMGSAGILTAAILPSQCSTCSSDINFGTTTAPGATKYVNFFNVMAYNYAGTWSGADPSDAPIGHIMQDIDALIPRVPADKIVLGIPFYGINYAGYAAGTTVTSYSNVESLIAEGKKITVDANGNAVNLSYASIKAKNLTPYYDTTKPTPGSTSETGWDYESAWAYDSTNRVLWNYDDRNTIAAKANWALTRTNLYDASSNNSNTAEPLAGIMSWDLSQDNASNTLTCAMEKGMKPSGTEVCTVPPTTTTLYDFETSTGSWTYNSSIKSIALSTTEHVTGTHSLAVVSATGSSVTQGLVYVPQSGLAAGGTVEFHVWVPANSKLTSVQPFIANSSYAWSTSKTTTFTAGAWNTYSIVVPANAIEIGVSFDSNGGFAGTAYIDSITYTTP